jgi:hypothetical protein
VVNDAVLKHERAHARPLALRIFRR